MDTYPEELPMQQSRQLPSGSYDYVIITNNALKNSSTTPNFHTLIQHKQSRGISATITTTEFIYANYNADRPDGGTDTQTQIRNFIIDAYNTWGIDYVLLGGDGDGGDVGGESGNTIIPHRGFYGEVMTTSGLETDNDIPADMYYACLDGTFDNDADGIYGETNDGPGGGEVDLYAEVYVGRAPVDSEQELANFVNKTIDYETSIYDKDALMVGEYLWSDPDTWGGDYKDEIKDGANTHGYTTVGFPASWSVDTLYERDTDWNKDDLMQRINNGLHVINHLGHANLQEVMKMSYWHVDDLTNSMYFLGYSQGCYAGSFDNRHSDGNIMNFDCVVEHFVVDNNASIGNPVGAFAFIANSRYGWGVKGSTNGASQRFDRQFWDAIFGEGINNLGKANQDSKEDNAGNINSDAIRWCYYELNLFGCPETPFGVVGPIGISVDGLEFYYTKDEEPDLDIPDGTSPWWEDDPTDPGEVRSYINIGSPIVETVDVFVDITHTWRGDISLDLISPAGNTYTLKTRDIYDDDEDIFATYTIGTTYQGEDARGTWTLWVRDWWVEMTGTLNLWRMKITSKTLSFGQLGAGDIIQSSSTTRFKVTNIGTQVEDFTLSLTNPSGWTAGDTAGDEVYVLKGLFVGNGDTPSSTHFASDDVITTSVQSATASRFGDAGMSANGHNVPANNSRYLWFQFQAPTATSITSEQAITVTIGAQAP